MTREELREAIDAAGGGGDVDVDAAIDAYMAAEYERLAQVVEALPGEDGEVLRRFTQKRKDGYLLAIEEAAGCVRAGGES